VVDESEVARRLAGTIHAHALINRGQVVQHGIGLINFGFEKVHHFAHFLCGNPGCGDLVTGCFGDGRQVRKFLLQLVNDIGFENRQLLFTPRQWGVASSLAGARTA
jgi:hypothetical protein